MEWNGNFGMEYGRCQNATSEMFQNKKLKRNATSAIAKVAKVALLIACFVQNENALSISGIYE